MYLCCCICSSSRVVSNWGCVVQHQRWLLHVASMTSALRGVTMLLILIHCTVQQVGVPRLVQEALPKYLCMRGWHSPWGLLNYAPDSCLKLVVTLHFLTQQYQDESQQLSHWSRSRGCSLPAAAALADRLSSSQATATVMQLGLHGCT
jgi:type II secretory pathway component PulL